MKVLYVEAAGIRERKACSPRRIKDWSDRVRSFRSALYAESPRAGAY